MLYMLAVGRVIGIILLVIVIVVILLLILPVTYKLDADLDELHGSLRIGWLCRLVRFRFVYDGEMEAVLSILFFHINFMDRERRQRRKNRKNESEKKKEDTEQKSLARRILGFGKTAVRVISLMREYQVLGEAMPPIRKFLYRCRPRKMQGSIEFGMSDPSRTGQITGAVAAVPVIYQTDLSVVPDFETEESYLSGDIHAKGHVLMCFGAALLIALIRSKNIRTFFGKLRNHN